MKKIILIILAMLVLGGGGYLAYKQNISSRDTTNNNPDSKKNNRNQPNNGSTMPVTDTSSDIIVVTSPKPNQVVSTPFTIGGRAQVFENQLNYQVVTKNNNELAAGTLETVATEPGEFGEFNKEITSIDQPTTQTGFIAVFDTSAKTGERVGEVRIPIIFENYQAEKDLSFPSTPYTDPTESFSIRYPNYWFLSETGTEGEVFFGEIISAWIVTSFEPNLTAGSGGIPENSTKIDFQILRVEEGFDLEEATNCTEQNTTCEEVIINGKTFTKSYTPTGQVPSLIYATLDDGRLIMATALFGNDPETDALRENISRMEEIASTFEILN